jgi:nucleotide-binding universal stress UspA family protein
LAEGILPYARSFARALKVPVELLQVSEPDPMAALSRSPQGTRYLETVAPTFPNRAVVSCSAESGMAAQIITEKAMVQPDAVIMMATHGRSGIQRWRLGSVADKVLHAAKNPILLYRAAENAPRTGYAELKTVLVPLDGSPLAESVLPLVKTLAQKMELEMALLRAYGLPISAFDASDSFTPDWEQLTEELRKEAQGYLERKVQELKREGTARVTSTVLEGNAAEKIIDHARQMPKNFVAMCTHGRSGIGRWVLGSVADRVVRYSGDPVLVLRASSTT